MSQQPLKGLVFVGAYLPGFKAGGPIRSISNLVEHIGDVVSFSIVTADRDLGESEPYSGVVPGNWGRVGKASVLYLPKDLRGLRIMWDVLRRGDYDFLYLNSVLSPMFSIIPLVLRRMGLTRKVPVVLAPRGELARSALALKRWKKAPYIWLAKVVGLYRGLVWHASSPHEESDIHFTFGDRNLVVMLPNLSGISSPNVRSREPKKPGRLRAVFLSRISRMKNLGWALSLLSDVRGDIEYHIFGPREDEEYWRECEETISSLRSGVKAIYHGSLAHEQVGQTLRDFDLFFVPTRGENYGHAIIESLSVGCPVLISDRTPWRGLSTSGVGWDLPLEEPDQFIAALQTVTDMDDSTWREWSDRASEFASRVANRRELGDRYVQMFRRQPNGVN